MSAAVAAGLASVSLAENPQQTGQGQQGQAGQGQRQRQLSQDAIKRFIQNAYSENQLEIQLGQKVTQQITDAQVKQLAQRIVEDHQRANQRLGELAKQMSIEVDQQLRPVQQAMFQYVTQLPAEQLEAEYLFHQLAAYDKAWMRNQWVTQNAQNERVKQFASQRAQTIQRRLQEIQQVAHAQLGITTPQFMGQVPGGQDSERQPEKDSKPGE